MRRGRHRAQSRRDELCFLERNISGFVDKQRDLEDKLRTYGSLGVADAFYEFVQRVRLFQINATTFETVRDQKGWMRDERDKMEQARNRVRESLREIERLVSEELPGL